MHITAVARFPYCSLSPTVNHKLSHKKSFKINSYVCKFILCIYKDKSNTPLLFIFSDYTLEFPKQGVTDYANIWGMRSLTQFTVCFWIKTTASRGTPFSYASTDALNNELLIEHPGRFALLVGNSKV